MFNFFKPFNTIIQAMFNFFKSFSTRTEVSPTAGPLGGLIESKLSVTRASYQLTEAMEIASSLKDEREQNHFRERFLATYTQTF